MKAAAVWVVFVASAVVAFALRGGVFAEDAEVPPPSEEEIKAAEGIAAELEEEKTLKEQERKITAEKHFNAATEASREAKYDVAIEELTAAVAADPDNQTYKDALKNARVMQISALLSEKKFTEAKELCDQFLSEYAGDERVSRFREQAVAQLEKPAAPVEEEELPPVPTEIPKPTAEQLLQEAKDLMLKKDYKAALEKLVEARKLSPHDIGIDKRIKRLNQEMTRFEQAYYEAVREEMMTQIYEAWTKVPRRAVKPEAAEAVPTVREPSPHKKEIEKKLEVIIPEVKFEDAKLTEVVDFLSREADVNIVIHPVVFQGYRQPLRGLETRTGFPGGVTPTPGPTITPTIPGPGPTYTPGETFVPGVTTPGVTAPGVTAPGLGPGITETTTMGTWVPPVAETGIRLSLKNVPLKTVLKYVLQWQNLKYVVEDWAILIAPIDYVPPESLETEIFRLSTTGVGIIERPELGITPSARGATGMETGVTRGPRLLRGPTDVGGAATGYETGLLGPQAEPAAGETIEDFLVNSGVPWPNYGQPGGSNIIYNRRTGQLIVTNTPTNLVLIRELVRLWDIPAHQVEIEARFVEILHTRYYEMSPEWQMLAPLVISKRATTGPVPSTLRRRFEVEAQPSRATRFFPQLLPIEFPTADADTILSLRGIMTEPEFQFLWRAIDQKDWSDLLSAPRVTTIAGQQAQIEVVQEITYPTEYDTETINIGGWGGTTNLVSGEIFMVTPGNWEKRDVGIILNVTPTVSADGKMITLVLLPEVSDLVRWINYGSGARGPDGRELYPIYQPVFETRNVTTTVHVNDGETIVLGGLITDKTTTYQDKVPLLGSIPFIGRLFRTTAETSSKANLIIFVTARLITSRGTELAAERAIAEEQARHLGQRIREEVGDLVPEVGTTGITE